MRYAALLRIRAADKSGFESGTFDVHCTTGAEPVSTKAICSAWACVPDIRSGWIRCVCQSVTNDKIISLRVGQSLARHRLLVAFALPHSYQNCEKQRSITLFIRNSNRGETMRKIIQAAALVAVAALSSAAIAGDQDDRNVFHATLTGFQEVTGPGPILSEGTGTLKLKLDRQAKTLTFWLTYSNLTPGAFMAHIHFGPVHVGGSSMVWFCGGAPVTPPAGVQPCPAGGGTATGTITGADVQAIAGQHV